MTNKIRIAIVGTGYFSQFHFDAWKRLDVNVVAICSLNENEAIYYSKIFNNCHIYSDFKKMIDEIDLDFVDIVIPPKDHLKLIKIAANKNVNIICQKPFTNSYSEAIDAVNISNKNNVLLIIHENFRFQPWYLKIKTILENNSLGELYQVSFRMRPGDGQGKDAYLNRQPYFRKMERFLIRETAIHFIDVFRFLFGEIESVFANLSKLNEHIKGEDAGYLFFNFENGIKGIFDGNRLSDHIAVDRRLTIGEMIIEGSDGTLRLNGNGELFERKFSSNKELKINYKWDNKGFAGDSVFKCQQHIINHYLKGKFLYNSGKDYLQNLKIEKYLYESNSEGKFLKIKNL
jgi:predicted dehydrogenase